MLGCTEEVKVEDYNGGLVYIDLGYWKIPLEKPASDKKWCIIWRERFNGDYLPSLVQCDLDAKLVQTVKYGEEE